MPPTLFFGSFGFGVGRFIPAINSDAELLNFFAHPFRVLNEIFDPSKATSARPRKLGLRPQTVRVRPVGTLPLAKTGAQKFRLHPAFTSA